MSQITTHVLDTALGKPGAGIDLRLQQLTEKGWQTIGKGTTDQDGRVGTLLQGGLTIDTGTYRMWFDTGAYFKAQNKKTFYPEVAIVFEVTDNTHYHVPLLLSPYGYSTYRGS